MTPPAESLPVRGAWIEIDGRCRCTFCIESLPVRGAWIEIPKADHLYCHAPMSLPVRGAWIEIAPVAHPNAERPSRSPCGERGLKFLLIQRLQVKFGRSPCGERGLKSKSSWATRRKEKSLPVRGAWIEITPGSGKSRKSGGRSPCGERGLK